MRKRLRNKWKQFKPGEIILVRGGAMRLPLLHAKVEDQIGEILYLSVGEFEMGMPRQFIEVIKRNLPPIHSWIEDEITFARHSVQMHDCALCRQTLAQKEAAFAHSIQ